MKKNRYLNLVAILLLSILFSRCEKAQDLISAKMEAKIDGVEWKSITRATNLVNNYFLIVGTSSAGEIIEITILGNSEGTYNLDLSNFEFSAIYKPNISSTTENYVASSGTIELSELDTDNKKISETFQFDAYKNLTEKISITEGTFENLNYIIGSK
jgi:hypothetical protein